jgi:hypothetical protein
MFCSKLNSLFVSLFVCLFFYFQENDTSTTARPATTEEIFRELAPAGLIT